MDLSEITEIHLKTTFKVFQNGKQNIFDTIYHKIKDEIENIYAKVDSDDNKFKIELSKESQQIILAGLHCKRIGDYFQVDFFNSLECKQSFFITNDMYCILYANQQLKENKTITYNNSYSSQLFNIDGVYKHIQLFKLKIFEKTLIFDIINSLLDYFLNSYTSIKTGGGNDKQFILERKYISFPIINGIYFLLVMKSKEAFLYYDEILYLLSVFYNFYTLRFNLRELIIFLSKHKQKMSLFHQNKIKYFQMLNENDEKYIEHFFEVSESENGIYEESMSEFDISQLVYTQYEEIHNYKGSIFPINTNISVKNKYRVLKNLYNLLS